MSQHVVSFVTKLITHFPIKHEADREQEWMASMVRNLRNYSADTLSKAAQSIIDNRTDRRFPLPSECRKVCDEIARREAAERPQRLPVDHKGRPEFSDWSIKLADDLIKCPLGRQAAHEGWLLSMHDFARANGRLPTGSEIAKCKTTAKEFDETYLDLLRSREALTQPDADPVSGWVRLGEVGVVASLLRLGDSMIKRRQELAEKVK